MKKAVYNIIFFILFLVVFLLPLDFGGHSIRAETFLRIMSFAALCLWLLLNKKISPLLKTYLILSGLFLSTCFLSCIFSASKFQSFSVWINYFSYFIIFFLAACIIREELLKIAPNILFFSALWVTIVGAYFFFITNSSGIEARFYSTFYQQDVYAGFILLVLPMGLLLYFGSESIKENIFYGIGSSLMSVSLAFTHSRGAWLSFIIIIPVIIYALKGTFNKKSLLKLFIFLFIVFIGVFYFNNVHIKYKTIPSLSERVASFTDTNDSSFNARWTFYNSALKIIKDHPVFGTGFGSFGDFYPRYVSDGKFYSRYVHNLYMGLASEVGIVQVLIFIVFLALIFKDGHAILKKAKDNDYLIITGLLLGLLANLMHSFVDVDWQFSAVCVYFFFSAGLIQAFRLKFVQADFENVVNRGDLALRYVTVIILILFFPFIIFPYIADCFSQTGTFFNKINEPRKAYYFHKKALKFNPFNYEYHKKIADLYLNKTGSVTLKEALKEAEETVRLCPEKAVLHQFLGKFYLENKDEKSFLNQVNEAISKDPVNYPSLYNDLAGYYLRMKNYALAEKYYLKAVSLFPEEYFTPMWYFRVDSVKRQISESYLALGFLYLDRGRNKDALFCFEKVRKLGHIKIQINLNKKGNKPEGRKQQ